MKVVLRKSLGLCIVWESPSETRAGQRHYQIANQAGTICTCEGFQYAGHCKHTADLKVDEGLLEATQAASPIPETE